MPLQFIEKRMPYEYKASDKKTKELLKMVNENIAEAAAWCEPEHTRAEENSRYERGFQWQDGDAMRQEQRERPALPLNSIVKVINAVANREILDRYVPKVFGRSSEDWGIAELLDETSRWQRDMAETEHEESMAFRANCASGYGVMHKYWDDAAMDGHGQIKDEDIPLWEMLWDPRAKKQNLIDRRYHISGKYVPVDELQEIYGSNSRKLAKQFKALTSGGRFTDSGVGSQTVGMRWGWRDIAAGRWYLSAKKEAFVVEMEWLSRKDAWKVAYPIRFEEFSQFLSDPSGQMEYGQDDQGQPLVMTGEQYFALDEETKKQFAQSVLYETELKVIKEREEFNAFAEMYNSLTGEDPEFTKSAREYVEYVISTNDIILQTGIRPMGFTYEFMTGLPFRQQEGTRWYGMVDIGKGPQDFKNKFFSNILTIYMTSPKNQLLIEESLVDNPNQFLNDYAKLGGVTFVPDGFVASFDSRVRQLDAPKFPDMLKELVTIIESALEDLFGLSTIEMGSQGDLRRVSGTTSAQARQATSTILAMWFDSLKRFRKRFGMLNVRFLQNAYEIPELVRIVGEDVAAGLTELSSWPDVNRFDIKIDEAPTSISEQMQTADFLTRTGTLEKWVDSGKMLFDDAIDLLVTLPKSTREKIKKNSQTMQQFQGQIQQLQAQIQQQELEKQAFEQFLLSVDRGGEIKTAFNAMFSMAQVWANQIAQQQQEQQQGQGMEPAPAPQM